MLLQDAVDVALGIGDLDKGLVLGVEDRIVGAGVQQVLHQRSVVRLRRIEDARIATEDASSLASTRAPHNERCVVRVAYVGVRFCLEEDQRGVVIEAASARTCHLQRREAFLAAMVDKRRKLVALYEKLQHFDYVLVCLA